MDWLAGLGRHRDHMVRLTRDLVAVDTENPPGRGYAACADVLERALRELDLEPERVDRERPCLSATWGTGDRALYLHGHYDVVPAQDRAQFEPRVEDGSIWGRGSADMKGGLAAMLLALAAVREAGAPIDGRVVVNLVPDEETGGPGGSPRLSRDGRLLRPGPSVGMLTPEPTSGVIWNASRGAITQRVTVRGREAHVGLMHAGDNAFERMVAIAQRLGELRAEVAGRRTEHAISPPEAAHSILLLGGSASSGSNFNVVPAQASFTLDRRPNPEEDVAGEQARLDAVFEELRADAHEIDVETLQRADSAGSPADAPLGRTLAESIVRIEGAAPAFELCPGVLEIRWYAREGLPAYAYGPGRLDLAHGPNEHLEIESLVRCAAVYAATIAGALQTVTAG
jgi:succinyl-diaminopimelate desuccinylase